MVVPIEQVKPLHSDRVQSVKKVMAILDKQGQIEPMQVKVLGPDSYTTFEHDPWSDTRILAAKQLGWKTLLIAPMHKYEE